MIIILALILVLIFTQQACCVKCVSFSCKHNSGGRCIRKNITIYDNTVTGLCLHHTDNMTKRILEPMEEIGMIEKSNPKIIKAQEDIKDEELLKNPKAFARWMREQGIGK